MEEVDRSVLAEMGVPSDAPVETLDVREEGPPAPLRQTLELLPTLGDDTVLVQYNDRAPRHLYPKLEDRGYGYETVAGDDVITTVVWVDGADDG